jgi:excinuclease UvrABC helicase subunit UvrB
MKRNKLSLEEAQQRINSQMPLADKIAKATYIIDNSTDIETTRKQVKDIHNKLKQSNLHWKLRILLSVCVITVFGSFRYLINYFW